MTDAGFAAAAGGALPLVLAGAGGALLGAVFYGGLWWTVGRALASPRPARWFFASLGLRTGVVLAGMYWLGGGDWRLLTLCLLGFIGARPLVARLTRSPPTPIAV